MERRSMKPIKHSVAFIIYNFDRFKFVIVRQPPNDYLSNIWGLPTSSLKEKEAFEDVVVRSAKDKLGLNVRIVKFVNEGEIEKDQYILHMKEFEVEIIGNDTPKFLK